jgi:hypothetical protein
VKRIALTVAVVAALVGVMPAQAVAATYWVEYPNTRSSVPFHNAIGSGYVDTGVRAWNPAPNLSLYKVSANPTSGISVRWDYSLSGRSIGGTVRVDRWRWSGTQWMIDDCTVLVNPGIPGVGRPTGRYLQAIVTHETGHCLGWWRHSTTNRYATSIMRTYIGRTPSLAGQRITPTSTDLARIGAGLSSR